MSKSMNLFVLLVFMPIGWGIAGLVRGRMQIALKRELRPPHLRRFAIGFIATPVVVVSACTIALYICDAFLDLEREYSNLKVVVFVFGMFSLPMTLAVILERAKKHASPIKSKVGDVKIVIPDSDGSKPDSLDLKD